MIKVLLADDSLLVRSILKDLFKCADDIEVIGEARNGREAVDLTCSLHPDLVILDIMMPVLDGLAAIDMAVIAVVLIVERAVARREGPGRAREEIACMDGPCDQQGDHKTKERQCARQGPQLTRHGSTHPRCETRRNRSTGS